jgi:NTE family protein
MRRRLPTILPALALTLALLAAATGCVRRTPNPPLAKYDPTHGYYFHTHQRPNNSPDTLLILCFSGGGTRAAALSYGVLEELRRTPLNRQGITNRLLDEVDAISSVSGGSITAAAYALYGDEVFDRLENAFLKKNVQTDLLWRTLNPFRWGKLMSKTYGRSELAADLYDEVLFHGATFADLAQNPGAFVAINATDVSTGARFSYTQYQFDLLCADLAPLRISSAVAASSAVPGLLSAVTLNNYAGTCDNELADAVRIAATGKAGSVVPRARFHFAEMATYLDRQQQPYIHLVDGGVSDNLGIRSVLDGIYAAESNAEVSKIYDLSRIERVAIVVVNAYSKPDKGYALREISPGTLTLAVEAAGIPVDRYSQETIELLKEQIERWRGRQIIERGPGSSPQKEVRFYPIVVGFSEIQDPAEQRYYMNQPTSFFLSSEAVDKLRGVGGQLLRESPLYQAFLTDLHKPLAPR